MKARTVMKYKKHFVILKNFIKYNKYELLHLMALLFMIFHSFKIVFEGADDFQMMVFFGIIAIILKDR